jgi:hypothetical protein
LPVEERLRVVAVEPDVPVLAGSKEAAGRDDRRDEIKGRDEECRAERYPKLRAATRRWAAEAAEA